VVVDEETGKAKRGKSGKEGWGNVELGEKKEKGQGGAGK